MIETILVATDGSDHADKALDLAGLLAAQLGAKVVLVHVMSPGPVPESLRRMAEVEHLAERAPAGYEQPLASTVRGGDPRHAEYENFRVHEAIGNQLLDAAERGLRKKGVKSISRRLEDGEPAEAILDAAAGAGVDMIVLGSRGLGSLKKLLVGSVSSKVCQLARCTCVSVK